MVDKKGLVFMYNLMLGITIIVLGLALASPTKSIIDEKMNDMTCSAPDTDWTQATCWFLDVLKPMTTGGIIFTGFAVLGAMNYFGKL